jgi:hypothetical protein
MADNNALAISDEEFLKQDPATFLGEVEDTSEENVDTLDQEITSVEEPTEEDPSKEGSEAQEQTDTDVKDEGVSQPEGDTQLELETESEIDSSESLDTSKNDSQDTKADKPETKEFDYESAYKKVTEPFKANGTDMQVTDPQDIVSLMQMGANYQKKMASLKPNLKMIKMLEKNNLLDVNKLSNLIDLSKKDPKAVAKLIQESGIDPLDIDADTKSDYQPTDHSVTDKEYNLDQVLDDIKDTPTFSKTINVLTKEWDSESKAVISDNPTIISIVNTHMGNGVFDKVNAVLQQQKTLGKLENIPDVEAYRQIAEKMNEEGLLTLDKVPPVSSEQTDNQTIAEAERIKKRKAAAAVKQTTSNAPKQDTNFLGLSDEEFMKKFSSR